MTNLNTVEVISAFAGQEANVIKIENNFSSFQIFAGESIKLIGLPEYIRLLPQTEGTDSALKTNILLMENGVVYQMINGDAFFVAVDEKGKVVSLSNAEIEMVHDWIVDAEYIKILN